VKRACHAGFFVTPVRVAAYPVSVCLRLLSQTLNLVYCMVRNRGQQDKSPSTTDCHQQEKQFLNIAPWLILDRERVSIPAL